MNDDYDNAKDDKAMLERARHSEHFRAPSGTQQMCRYCWRPLYWVPSLAGRPGDGTWDLVYREYPETEYCDARSSGADLSTLPHEPVARTGVSLAEVITAAAMKITMPGSWSKIEANSRHDWAMVGLITAAAGLGEDMEVYVMHAVILAACDIRGPEFRAAAYREHLTDPPASWPKPKHVKLGPSRVTTRKEAERREQAWIEAGRPGHPFTQAGEQHCRVCGCQYDGIQHDERYPEEGL